MAADFPVGTSLGLLVAIGIYFSNTWYSAYLLPNSNQAFDRFGALYNVTSVLKPDRTLDVDAFREYSPLYYSAGYNLVFGAYFAQYTAALLYALLEHWEQLKVGARIGVRQVKSLWKKKEDVEDDLEIRPELDVHFKLMRQYPEAKQWWFAVVTLVSFVMGVIACEVYDTTMPVWGIVLTMALAALFLIPAGIIFAISVSLFLCEIVICWLTWFPECAGHSRRSSRGRHRCGYPWATLCQYDWKNLRLGW
jgi:hypothetical protein